MSLVKALFSCNLQASVGPLRSWVTAGKENEDNNRIEAFKNKKSHIGPYRNWPRTSCWAQYLVFGRFVYLNN